MSYDAKHLLFNSTTFTELKTTSETEHLFAGHSSIWTNSLSKSKSQLVPKGLILC